MPKTLKWLFRILTFFGICRLFNPRARTWLVHSGQQEAAAEATGAGPRLGLGSHQIVGLQKQSEAEASFAV
jgi:hypothetical protein